MAKWPDTGQRSDSYTLELPSCWYLITTVAFYIKRHHCCCCCCCWHLTLLSSAPFWRHYHYHSVCDCLWPQEILKFWQGIRRVCSFCSGYSQVRRWQTPAANCYSSSSSSWDSSPAAEANVCLCRCLPAALHCGRQQPVFTVTTDTCILTVSRICKGGFPLPSHCSVQKKLLLATFNCRYLGPMADQKNWGNGCWNSNVCDCVSHIFR